MTKRNKKRTKLENSDSFLEDLLIKNSEFRDKALLTLGTTSLGFTISAYEKIYSGIAHNYLYSVWVLFAVVITFTLLSSCFAAKAVDIKICNKSNRCYNFYYKLSLWLTRLSVFSFISGVMAFVFFCFVNLENTVMDKQYETKPINLNNSGHSNLSTHGLLPPSSSVVKPPRKDKDPSDKNFRNNQ